MLSNTCPISPEISQCRPAPTTDNWDPQGPWGMLATKRMANKTANIGWSFALCLTSFQAPWPKPKDMSKQAPWAGNQCSAEQLTDSWSVAKDKQGHVL